MSRQHAPWTEEEDAYVLDTPFANPADVAKALGRTKSGVENRRKKLRNDKGLGLIFGSTVTPFKPGGRTLVAKTCLGCGFLLSSDWYRRYKPGPRSKAGGYLRKCERCRRVGEAPQVTRNPPRPSESKGWMQRASQAQAERKGMPWMERDMEVLSNPDMTILEKALALKRTYKAVLHATQKHDFPSKKGLGDPARDGWHIDNPNVKDAA